MMHLKQIRFSILVLMLILTILFGGAKIFSYVPLKELARWLPILGIVTFIIGILLTVFRKDKVVLTYAVTFSILLGFSQIISSNIIEYQYQQVFEDGGEIAVALEKYKSDHNKYPSDLKELVPIYISSIKKIKLSWESRDIEFNYFVKDNGHNYYLNFEGYYYDGEAWLQEP